MPTLLTPQEVQKTVEKWSKRTDLPPRSHWLREPKGWMFPDGSYLPEGGVLHETNSLTRSPQALALVPELNTLLEDYNTKKAALREEAAQDDPEKVDPEGYDLQSDDLSDELNKKAKDAALRAGLVLIRTRDLNVSVLSHSGVDTTKAERFQTYINAVFKKGQEIQ